MTKLHIEVIRKHDALVAMGREWDELVARAHVGHPFLRHDWVCSWWECFGAGKELNVLAVRSGETLIGLAPLMRTRARMYGVPVRRLELIANVHTPRFDFIVADRADEVYPAILDYLQTQDPDWDIVMLPELAEGSRTEPELRQFAAARSLRIGLWVAGASPRIPLVGTFDEFRATLSSKRRGNLRQRLRRLELLGTVAMEVVTDREQLASALQDALRIEAASWKGEAGTAIVRNDDIKRFYQVIAERAAQSKTLSLQFLKVGDKRIAFAYCLRQGRALYVLKTGYDPEYAACSPFNALLFFAIESAFQEGLEAIDLLGDDDPWKRAWTQQCTERRWLYLYRNTAPALIVYYLKVAIVPWLKRRQLAAHAHDERVSATATATATATAAATATATAAATAPAPKLVRAQP